MTAPGIAISVLSQFQEIAIGRGRLYAHQHRSMRLDNLVPQIHLNRRQVLCSIDRAGLMCGGQVTDGFGFGQRLNRDLLASLGGKVAATAEAELMIWTRLEAVTTSLEYYASRSPQATQLGAVQG